MKAQAWKSWRPHLHLCKVDIGKGRAEAEDEVTSWCYSCIHVLRLGNEMNAAISHCSRCVRQEGHS